MPRPTAAPFVPHRREHALKVALSDDEREHVRAAAAALMRPPGEYARLVLLGHVAPPSTVRKDAA